MKKNLYIFRNYFSYISSKQKIILFILCIFLTSSFILAFLKGGFSISLIKFLNLDFSPIENEVLLKIRFPRVILAFFVGSALGIVGATLQGLFRNPLADPGLIGVSAGAALGAVFSIVLINELLSVSFLGSFLLPLSSIIGSLFTIILLYSITRGFGYEGITYMLLIGIAINALATVGIGFLTYISNESQLRGLTFWMMGSFGNSTWSLVIPAIIIIFISILCLLPYSRQLDLIQLGELEAERLGIDIKKLKLHVILSCALMIGASVSISGMIGFVGLVIPHLVRLIGGVNHNYLLLGSSLMGGGLMVLADLLSRILLKPAELPVGLVTSAIGSPFFLWLIIKVKKK